MSKKQTKRITSCSMVLVYRTQNATSYRRLATMFATSPGYAQIFRTKPSTSKSALHAMASEVASQDKEIQDVIVLQMADGITDFRMHGDSRGSG